MRGGIHDGKEIADLPTLYLQGIIRYWSVDVPAEAEAVIAAREELWKRIRAGDYRIQVPQRGELYCGCKEGGRAVYRIRCVIHGRKD